MTRLTCFALACVLLTAGSSTAHAAELIYNFTFELTNISTNADFFVDGDFTADPTLATTNRGPDGLGENWSVPADSLAVTLFDLGGTVGGVTANYGKSTLQNTGLVYFSSFDPANGLSDPIFTLSAKTGTQFLTLLLNGSSAKIFGSASIGDTSGSPLATGPGINGAATALPGVPEPSTFGLIGIAALAACPITKARRAVQRQSSATTA